MADPAGPGAPRESYAVGYACVVLLVLVLLAVVGGVIVLGRGAV